MKCTHFQKQTTKTVLKSNRKREQTYDKEINSIIKKFQQNPDGSAGEFNQMFKEELKTGEEGTLPNLI